MTSLGRHPVSVNPLQFAATPDGWFDFSTMPPRERVLEAVASAGFEYVQPLLDSDDVSAFVRELSATGLRAGPGYLTTPNPLHPDPVLDDLRRSAARQAEAGARLCFLSPETQPDTVRFIHPAQGRDSDADAIARTGELLAAAASVALPEGIDCAVHPHVGSALETEGETRAVLDAHPTLNFGPDLGHLAWAGARIDALLTDFGARTRGVHVKDIRLAVARASVSADLDYRSTVAVGLWAEPGDGDLDLDALLALLGADDDRWLVIEVDATPLDPDESLRRSARWVASASQRAARRIDEQA